MEDRDAEGRAQVPAVEAIRRQVRQILEAKDFDASQRNRRFLEYVVEEALAGRAGHIKAYNIATTVFGRDDDFDSQTDPIIRIEASRLRRSLDHYFLTVGKDDPIRITIPKGSYVPLFKTAHSDPPAASTPVRDPETKPAVDPAIRTHWIPIAPSRLLVITASCALVVLVWLGISWLGGYSHVQLVFDGKMLTLVDKDRNVFGQTEAAGTVDQVIDKLRQDLAIELPGGDLLESNLYDVLSTPVLDAKHIGRGIVDGVECEHLAFRNADVDWQIWIEVGDRPVPRKYVITTKTLAAAPQYSLRLHDWSFDPPSANSFQFTPPDGAKKVAMEELKDIDELPPPAAPGGGQ